MIPGAGLDTTSYYLGSAMGKEEGLHVYTIGCQHGKLWFSGSSTMGHNGFSMDVFVCVLSALSHNPKFIG